MAEAWETKWAALDPPTRARLRRAAFRGQEVPDRREAALVAAFARTKATEPRGRRVALHLVIIAGITAALIFNLTSRDGHLAPVYGALLVIDVGLLVFFLRSKDKLLEAAERNQRRRR